MKNNYFQLFGNNFQSGRRKTDFVRKKTAETNLYQLKRIKIPFEKILKYTVYQNQISVLGS